MLGKEIFVVKAARQWMVIAGWCSSSGGGRNFSLMQLVRVWEGLWERGQKDSALAAQSLDGRAPNVPLPTHHAPTPHACAKASPLSIHSPPLHHPPGRLQKADPNDPWIQREWAETMVAQGRAGESLLYFEVSGQLLRQQLAELVHGKEVGGWAHGWVLRGCRRGVHECCNRAHAAATCAMQQVQCSRQQQATPAHLF